MFNQSVLPFSYGFLSLDPKSGFCLVFLLSNETHTSHEAASPSQLLDAYFTRAQKEQKEKFLKNHGFSLLANQLYIHQGSQGLLECFLEMLFGRPMGLEEE